jgi:hypothetical protein
MRQPGYWVLTRAYSSVGSYDLIDEFVPDNSSTGCRNVSHDSDPACQGCKFPKDMEYINRMKELK